MTQARVRRIGNSLGVIIPKAEAKRRSLREGDLVNIQLSKARSFDEAWGLLRGKLGDLDELNDLVDEGEDLD